MNDDRSGADAVSELSPGDSPYDYAGSRRHIVPRSRWSNMDDREFLRAAENEQLTDELVDEFRRRMEARLANR